MEFKYKTIGVLGGMGAAASANFYQSLVNVCQQKFAAEKDSDFPPILIYNLPLTDFDEKGFVDLDNVRAQLKYGLEKLEKSGSEVIVIPCNTVHYLFDEMQSWVDIPIISILDAAVEILKKKNIKKVGILSSSDTKKLKLYKAKLMQNKFEIIETSQNEQDILDQIILKVISGKQSEDENLALERIIKKMIKNKATVVLLGCTEIPLALKNRKSDTINTIDILAESVLDYVFENPKT